jgi:hypothetical protein
MVGDAVFDPATCMWRCSDDSLWNCTQHHLELDPLTCECEIPPLMDSTSDENRASAIAVTSIVSVLMALIFALLLLALISVLRAQRSRDIESSMLEPLTAAGGVDNPLYVAPGFEGTNPLYQEKE